MDRFINPTARREPSTLAFHVSRIVIDAGVLLAMVAMNMSFVTSETLSKNSVAADALPVLLLLAPVFAMTLIPDHSRPVPNVAAWIALGLAAAAFPYAVVKYFDASNLAATLDGSVGFGSRLLVFGTFVTIAGIGIGLAGGMLSPPGGRPRSTSQQTPRSQVPAQRPAGQRRRASGGTREQSSAAPVAPVRRAQGGQEPVRRASRQPAPAPQAAAQQSATQQQDPRRTKQESRTTRPRPVQPDPRRTDPDAARRRRNQEPPARPDGT